ncbi:fasciclin domain-containing protein [Litorimonas sp. RW-G-Af-16]|uniref:fasciclin domain-containing protein n=1 Tax=Litorimonas sp. RW-G-Af-16 TaxID=3241168 RepID=UPI00390C4B5B
MKTLTSRVKRNTALVTFITASFAIAGTANASDCAMKKAKQTAQHTTTANTAVMSSPIVYVGNYKKDKKGTIVDAAVATESLSTLVAAVKAADLVGALSGDGPLTVFAPTNMAFEELPTGTVDTLLKPENIGSLQNILKAHVVAGKLSAADIIGLAEQNGGSVEVETLSGAKLTAVLSDGNLMVKDEQGGLASVKKADIMKSNGVVHIVDRVLLSS